jgi:hypothetical protein
MTHHRFSGLLAALTLAVAAPTAADAMTFLNAGDTGAVTIVGYDKPPVDQFVSSLSADLSFTLLSQTNSNKSWNFSYTADNTSSDLVARLVSFATSVDPNFKSSGGVSGASGAFTAAKGSGLEGFDVELCFFAGSNCNGGGNAGITSGAANATGLFTLNFASAPTSGVTFSDFIGKSQATQYNNSSLAAKECTPGAVGCGGGGNEVPEPSTWALMILGFGAAGAALRRRRTAFA